MKSLQISASVIYRPKLDPNVYMAHHVFLDWGKLLVPKIEDVTDSASYPNLSLIPPTINQEIPNFLCQQCNQILKKSRQLRSYLRAQIHSNHCQVPLQTWTIESYLCCLILGEMICTVTEERGAPHGQSERGDCLLLKLADVPHPGRGEEDVHWEKQVYMKPQNSSRREEAWYGKLENSLC